MAKQQAPLDALKDYLPEGTFEKVSEYLHQYRIHLTITRERTTVLGDYRNAVDGKNHRISVNGNLNKFAFLYTLIHEIAHLLIYDQFGHRVASHVFRKADHLVLTCIYCWQLVYRIDERIRRQG